MTPGELTRETETRYLAKLPSGVVIETPVHRYRGEKDGPTVYVQALQHGGEVIGAVVLRRIHDRLLGTSLAGTVISVPVANPLAVDHRRYLAPSRVDAVNSNMNRQWPGDENGTIFQRMVDRLWTLAGEADVIIDLHTGGPDMLSHVRFTPGHSQSRELATAFGLDLVVGEGSPDSSGESDGGGGKLREVAAENDIPCITPELTHSRAVVEDSVESGVDGVMNVLKTVGVRPDDTDQADPTVGSGIESISTRASGLFEPAADVGEGVSAGQPVGTVYDPGTFERLSTVTSEEDGLLLSNSPGATVVEGEQVASIVPGLE